MSERITYKEIRDRIESTAKEIIAEETTFPKESSYEAWESYQQDLEALQSEAHDKAHESVDSWDWTIYTHMGFQVYDALMSVEQCEAEQAFEDCGGYEQAADQRMGPYEMGCAMAYHWLVQELANEVMGQCEELVELAQGEMDKF